MLPVNDSVVLIMEQKPWDNSMLLPTSGWGGSYLIRGTTKMVSNLNSRHRQRNLVFLAQRPTTDGWPVYSQLGSLGRGKGGTTSSVAICCGKVLLEELPNCGEKSN